MTQSDRYHYTECGLDNVYLLNGFKYVETPRGKGATIKDRDGLHRAIGRYLVREKKNLSGKEFRFLRHELDMTQLLIANLLNVDVQTVARWEKRKTVEIPGPAQGLIRLLYEEHTNGNRKITTLLAELAELDEIIHGDDEALEFEDTEEGWQASDLVAA
jgi:putative transcriptional regulator